MRLAARTALSLIALAVSTAAVAETPSLRLTAPAWMLRADNPLRVGKPYDGAVVVQLPGYRHDPPLEVPAAPRTWPPAPDIVEADQILSHLKVEAELGGEMLIHATSWFGDATLVLASVASTPPMRIVLPLVKGAGGEWQVAKKTVFDEPLLDALRAAWDESGWIEVIDTDMRGLPD